MGAHGITLAEEGHFVTLIAPCSALTALTSERFSMENWAHATILVLGGAGSGFTVTVSDSMDAAGSGESSMVFDYAQEETADGDVFEAALVAATTAGVSMTSATGIFMVIEINDDELRDGYHWLQINTDATVTRYLAAAAILTGGRYMEDITATVIS